MKQIEPFCFYPKYDCMILWHVLIIVWFSIVDRCGSFMQV